jgi:F420-non-reducing hydrogenase iron-sulfur subunit
VEYTRGLLESIGLEGQRLQMINVSAAMAGEFAFSAAEITAEISRLGPSPLQTDGTRPPVEITNPIED